MGDTFQNNEPLDFTEKLENVTAIGGSLVRRQQKNISKAISNR